MQYSNDPNPPHRLFFFRKTLLYFTPPFLVTGLILFGLLALNAREERLVHESRQLNNLSLLISELEHTFSVLLSDINLLSAHHELRGFLKTGNDDHLEGLTEEFITFLEVMKSYDQVRLIGSEGMEKIRINYRNGRARVVPTEALQNKSRRYYFNEIRLLRKTEVYLSLFDFNYEKGIIEEPFKPAIRVGKPLFDLEGRFKGMLIANYLGASLLRGLNEVVPAGIDQYLLTDSDEFWIQKNPEEDRWQFSFKNKNSQPIQERFPEIWKKVSGGDTGQFFLSAGLVTTGTFNPSGKLKNGKKTVKPRTWRFVTIVPQSMLSVHSTAGFKRALLVYTLLSLGFAGGSYAFAIVTFRKEETEQSLVRSEARHKRLVDTSPYGIQEIDTEGNILFVSRAYYKMLGYNEGELIGTNLRVLLTNEKRDWRMSYIARLVSEQPETEVFFDRQKMKDGRVIDVEVAWNYNRNNKGEVVGFISVITDITKRKRAEKERAALFEELEAKNAELEQYAYTVSHDLKSPLITIRGFLGLLEKDITSGNSAEVQSDITRISNAAEKMNTLLQDLLELSRIGRVVNPLEKVHLGDLVSEALEAVKGRLDDKEIKVEVAPDLPVVDADRLRIRQVFENLIDNAGKFIGDQPNPLIEIGVRLNGGERVIYVRDNGIGIKSRYHETVFGLFNRLDLKVEGTGIGLAIIKRIIESHEGRIWVESEGLGKGSTFCFTLSEKGNIDDKKSGGLVEG